MSGEDNPSNLKIEKSRLFCRLEESNVEISISLVDYRNNYFTSDDPNKIIEFYNGFENRDQLIQWMKERPHGVAYIHEVDGNKNVIVVIPTSDYNGKYAKECRDNIFKGLHMVFVESGGRGDYYFNSAHNINIGIKIAMEYNPKWIVYSGDDMIKIDSIFKLVKELENLNNRDVDAVFTLPGQYHSAPMFLGKPKFLFPITLGILKKISERFTYVEKTYFQLKRFNDQVFFPRYKYSSGFTYKIVNFIFFKKIESFTNFLSFGIFSSCFIERTGGKLFDETYINEDDDTDLSIRIKHMAHATAVVDFRINEYIGSSLGVGGTRTARVIPGWTYFSYKMDKGDFHG